jgi:hypothetical protein
LTDLVGLFRQAVLEPETVLEQHQHPWANVYLIQHGVVRLFREALSGKIAIHHFFSEGDMVWPVFSVHFVRPLLATAKNAGQALPLPQQKSWLNSPACGSFASKPCQ